MGKKILRKIFPEIIALRLISGMDIVSRFDEAERTKARNGKAEIRLVRPRVSARRASHGARSGRQPVLIALRR